MAITPQTGYKIDPNNPNAVIKDTSSAMPGSVASFSQPSITSQNTVTQPQINLTPKPDNNNYLGILAGAQQQALSLQQQIQAINQPTETKGQSTSSPTTGGTDIKSYIDSIMGVQQPNAMQTYQQGYDQSGLAQQKADLQAKAQVTTEAQGRLNNISAQLTALNTEAQAIPIQAQQDSTGRGRTAGGLAPIQADALRANALKALPLQAQAAVIQAEVATAQGNQKLAQDLYIQASEQFDKMFTLQMQDAQNKYEFQTGLINKVYEFADKQQTRQLQAIEKQADRDYQTQRDTILYNQDLEKLRIQNANKTAPTGGADSTYENDLDAIIGATLSTIPSKFGQQTFQTQINNARNDADRINLVAAQVLKGAPAETKTDFANQAVGISMIEKAIAEIDNGVKTGAINAGKQYVYNLAGKDYDPALAKINGYITSAIQPYRNSVTGAAWGDQEEAEYNSLFGSTKYSPTELKQRLLQTKELLKSKSSVALNSYVNPLGTYENTFNTGSLQNQTIAPLPTDEPQTKTFMQSLNNWLWGSN